MLTLRWFGFGGWWPVVLAAAGCFWFTVVGAAPVIEGEKMSGSQWLYECAPAVLFVELVDPGKGSKYLWATVRVLEVLKNETGRKFGESLEVAYLSFAQTIPPGKSVIYIEPYSEVESGRWSLVFERECELRLAGENSKAQARRDDAVASDWLGHEYNFNEERAVDRLWELVRVLESRDGLPGPPVGRRDAEELAETNLTGFPEIVEIGWVLVAIGSFGEGSDRLREVVFFVKERFGHLAVPYWVCTDEERKRFLLAAAQGPVEGVNDPMQSLGRFSRSLYHLADLAEKAVSARGGYQFEGYDGPVYSGF